MLPSQAPRKPPPVARFPYERLGDAELVQAAAEGDADAVSAVWDRYAPLVRTVLRSSVGMEQDVEDLLQEVFLAFFRGAAAVRQRGALRGYLVSVAVRLVLVELRRRRVRRWVSLSPSGEVPDVPSAPVDVEAGQALRALHRLLAGMPPRRRLAFVLRNVQGLEVSEVAAALGTSESTIKREVARARAALLTRARACEPTLWELLERMGGAVR